jgi:hypothetical protein
MFLNENNRYVLKQIQLLRLHRVLERFYELREIISDLAYFLQNGIHLQAFFIKWLQHLQVILWLSLLLTQSISWPMGK